MTEPKAWPEGTTIAEFLGGPLDGMERRRRRWPVGAETITRDFTGARHKYRVEVLADGRYVLEYQGVLA